MAEKMQNSFYLLREKVVEFNEVNGKRSEKQADLPYLQKRFKSKGYKPQKLKPAVFSGYDIALFYRRKPSPVKWKAFIEAIADDGADILKHREAMAESFIMVLSSKATKKLFAVTGGFGHLDILEIAEGDLGIEILSRIVKKEDKALLATREHSLTGGIQGAIKFFRTEFNLYENESFGVIYQQLTALLDKSKLVKMFGFSLEDLRSGSTCIAKNSFAIKKSLNLKELLRVISACEKILKGKPIVQINAVTKVNKTQTALLSSLNAEVDKQVFAVYEKPSAPYSVEISHKDFEKYFQAQKTILSFWHHRKLHTEELDQPIRDIQGLAGAIRSRFLGLDKTDFDKIIDRGYLKTEDGDGTPLTSGLIRDHYCTEIRYSGKSYFLVEKDWYEISATMIESINEDCTAFVKDRAYTGPQVNKWLKTYKDENQYNASYLSLPDSLVFDKVTPDNIEVCDVLRWDKDRIYFYHVKKGFDNSMRDLCNQVYISARKVMEDAKSKYEFIGRWYDKVKNSKGKSAYAVKARAQLAKISRQQFLDLFTSRKPVFVLAVLDTSKAGTRTLADDMKSFDSNIAKFSLNELAKNMRTLGMGFEVLQLGK